MNAARAFTLLFISGWLIAWSAGIYFAALIFLASFWSGLITVFVGGWLLAALSGWCFAANTIYRLATGKPIELKNGQSY